MTRRLPLPLPLLLILAATALPAALAAQDSTKPQAKAPAKLRRDPELISQAEIAAAQDIQTAYDLVKRLRPNWFSIRGPSSINLPTAGVVVYVNEVKRGGPDTLRDLPLTGLQEIRHMRGTDASQRFGLGHENGAILVTLR
ncbi:MAG TPA: hypothetical protein VGQ17_13405 [Gemmatimonadales bacterium]|jgi:hypothetical protein|nr:hypothetical protein [Gemmatimonadales bacterium]